MGEAVERTHAIADAGQQPALRAQDGGDAVLEVFDGVVGEGDDQDFALVQCCVLVEVTDELGGQLTEGEGLSAAGYGADTHVAARVLEDSFLFGAQGVGGRHASSFPY